MCLTYYLYLINKTLHVRELESQSTKKMWDFVFKIEPGLFTGRKEWQLQNNNRWCSIEHRGQWFDS